MDAHSVNWNSLNRLPPCSFVSQYSDRVTVRLRCIGLFHLPLLYSSKSFYYKQVNWQIGLQNKFQLENLLLYLLKVQCVGALVCALRILNYTELQSVLPEMMN